MSARITIHCDSGNRYGTCTAQLFTDALTIGGARVTADRHGWRTHPDGNDYCPAHSGRPPQPHTSVVRLQPAPSPTDQEQQ